MKNSNTKKIKLAFFGTSDRSLPILNSLKKSNFEIALCVTKNDVKVGRDQTIKPTKVKEWALENNINLITINSLKNEDKKIVIKTMENKKIDLGIVADFSFMIPEEIFNMPEYKFINIHFSLLPKYRGASPVQFAILNGDKKTGITYQLLHRKMDMGKIIYQSEHILDGHETSGQLYNTLFQKAADEIEGIVIKYAKGALKTMTQDETHASYTSSPTHPKNTFIFKEDGRIDWKESEKKIEASIRAYNPWPIAWTTLENLNRYHSPIKNNKDGKLKVKIHKARLDNGKLIIDEIQVEGGKKISWKEFGNGYLA